ncbi:MAG: hypothetical protein JEZ11_03515 [Desulfobacterales bacterium]|nr:hypothetical protein [Desulfobacterales bacterium]
MELQAIFLKEKLRSPFNHEGLCKGLWEKFLRNTGWEIIRARRLFMYPLVSMERLLLQPFWRKMSFEGFGSFR